MGYRPGAADFGIYGQLAHFAHFDSTPMAHTLREAPRAYAWVDIVDDLSGCDVEDKGWIVRNDLSAQLGGLLKEIGRTYVPVMLANAAALQQGENKVSTTVDGQVWIQQPFPYQAKCIQWLKELYDSLSKK